jgi:predicted ribosome quality control (RQC) complex YloA/Tae2 family protein
VVLRGPEGEDPPRSLLETAAAVAAHFSRAAKAGVVGVSCTQVKHVSRAARRPKGTVTIRREHVLKVRPGLPPVDESPDG